MFANLGLKGYKFAPKGCKLQEEQVGRRNGNYILEYCETWRSIGEIAQFAERDKNYTRNKVLPRLAGKLEIEFLDVPNHSKQRYRVKQRRPTKQDRDRRVVEE